MRTSQHNFLETLGFHFDRVKTGRNGVECVGSSFGSVCGTCGRGFLVTQDYDCAAHGCSADILNGAGKARRTYLPYSPVTPNKTRIKISSLNPDRIIPSGYRSLSPY